jgi:hypothetical protein
MVIFHSYVSLPEGNQMSRQPANVDLKIFHGFQIQRKHQLDHSGMAEPNQT